MPLLRTLICTIALAGAAISVPTLAGADSFLNEDPVTAADAAPISAEVAASGSPMVRVASCSAGGREGRSATFVAQMKAMSRGGTMQMRFDLLSRSLPKGAWAPITGLHGYGNWDQAGKSATIFRTTKSIGGLSAGKAYRVAVTYRWRDAKGKIAKRGSLLSAACEQPQAQVAASSLKVAGR